MAEPNPFERVFTYNERDKSGINTLLGTVGGMFGIPSVEQQEGSLRSRAFEEYAKRVEAGETPSAAFIGLMKTPQGMEFFKTPGALEDFKAVIANQVAGRPTITSGAPGSTQTSWDQQGRPIASVSTPTNEQQNFKFWKEVAQLSPEQWKEVAQIQLMPEEDRKLHTLRTKFGLSHEQALIVSNPNLIKVIPLKETDLYTGTAKETGRSIIYNVMSGEHRVIGGPQPPGSAVPLPSTPTKDDPQGIRNDAEKLRPFKTGTAANVIRGVDEFIRSTIDVRAGTPEGDEQTQNENARKKLLTTIVGMPEVVGRSNMVINSWKDLIGSQWRSQSSALDAGIKLKQLVQGEIQRSSDVILDKNLNGLPPASPQTKQAESKWLQAVRKLDEMLPSLESLQILREETLRTGGGSLGLAEGISAAGKGVRRGVEAGTNVIFGRPAVSPEGNTAAPQNVPVPRARPAAAGGRADDPMNIRNMSWEELKKLNVNALPPEQKALVIQRGRILADELRKASGRR